MQEEGQALGPVANPRAQAALAQGLVGQPQRSNQYAPLQSYENPRAVAAYAQGLVPGQMTRPQNFAGDVGTAYKPPVNPFLRPVKPGGGMPEEGQAIPGLLTRSQQASANRWTGLANTFPNQRMINAWSARLNAQAAAWAAEQAALADLGDLGGTGSGWGDDWGYGGGGGGGWTPGPESYSGGRINWRV